MTAPDRWTSGDDYERWIGRWSRPVGNVFIDWLGMTPASRWLDVGCGTGALTETILGRAAPATILGIDPSADFVAHARAHVDDPRATFEVAPAGAIPLADAAVDVAVAGLVLNFVPDLPAALGEIRRVVAPGGTVGGYVWDYAGRMDLIRRFFEAAIALDQGARSRDEGVRFPICAAGPFAAAFDAAGFDDVEVRPIEIATVFRDFDDYWTPFLTGVGPAPGYAMSLDDDRRDALRERLRSDLPTAADGSIALIARAWAVRGRTGQRSSARRAPRAVSRSGPDPRRGSAR